MTKVSGPLWDAQSIATVLEYCSCVWLHTLEASAANIDVDAAAACPTGATFQRSWVALDVLRAEPFLFSLAGVVQFYGRMIAHVGSWCSALQAMLPETSGWPHLAEDDVYVHLSEVVLAVFSDWIREVQERSAEDPNVVSSFRETWQQSGEGLLAGTALRLNGLQYHNPVARRLLPEALRLEAAGRQTCGYAVPSASSALEAALGSDTQIGNPQAASG